MLNLSIINVNVNAAQEINCLGHCRKVHTDIILDIQIQVLIQHAHGLLRTTCGICAITLVELSIRQIKIGITVYTDQFYFFGIIIDTCNNDGVTSVSASQLSCLTGIEAEKCHRCISLHGLQGRFLNCVIHFYFFRVYLRLLELIQLAYYPESKHQNQNYRDLDAEDHHALFLSGRFFLSSPSASFR